MFTRKFTYSYPWLPIPRGRIDLTNRLIASAKTSKHFFQIYPKTNLWNQTKSKTKTPISMLYGSGSDVQRVMNQNKALLGKRRSLSEINTVYGSAVLGDKTKSQAPTFTKKQIEKAKQKIRIQNKKKRIRKFIFYVISLLISFLILFGFVLKLRF